MEIEWTQATILVDKWARAYKPPQDKALRHLLASRFLLSACHTHVRELARYERTSSFSTPGHLWREQPAGCQRAGSSRLTQMAE